jgi:uncharacterized metal-binding protein YceD (DUF177 family)
MKAKPKPEQKSPTATTMDMRKSSKSLEFSRRLAVESLPDAGLSLKIAANASERESLAKLNDLVAIENLEADFTVKPKDGSKIGVTGTFRAQVIQTCVVSLEPFESEIEAEIEVDFASDEAAAQALAEDRPDHEQPEAPDPIIDGMIDLGALTAEFLVLSLDPYPRRPGVRFESQDIGGKADAPVSPFAALGKLKDRP